MSALLNKIKQALSVNGSRTIVIFISLLGFVLLVLLIRDAGNNKTSSIDEQLAGSHVKTTASGIDKSKLDEKNIHKEGSPIKEELAKIREGKIATAKKNRTTHLDGLRLKEDEDKEESFELFDPNEAKRKKLAEDAAKKKAKEDAAKKRQKKLDKMQKKAIAKPIVEKNHEEEARKAREAAQKKADKKKREAALRKKEHEKIAAYVGNVVADSQSYSKSLAGYINSMAQNEKNFGFSKEVHIYQTKVKQKAAAHTQKINPEKSVEQLYPGDKGFDKKGEKKPYSIFVGDVHFGVIQISINSDEQSPLRAEIVGGDLDGAVLVGNFKVVAEKVIVLFNSMVFEQREYPVNIVAIDPDTLRSALADDVDHHYLERYGSLIAATFAEGYASSLAIPSDGRETKTTTVISPDGTVTEQKPKDYTDKEMIITGIGNVGSSLAEEFQKHINRKPTIHVYENKEVGLMFLSSLIVNGEDPKTRNNQKIGKYSRK